MRNIDNKLVFMSLKICNYNLIPKCIDLGLILCKTNVIECLFCSPFMHAVVLSWMTTKSIDRGILFVSMGSLKQSGQLLPPLSIWFRPILRCTCLDSGRTMIPVSNPVLSSWPKTLSIRKPRRIEIPVISCRKRHAIKQVIKPLLSSL